MNNPYHLPSNKGSVVIGLTCGCMVNARNRPMNPKAKYPCPSNQGHGYNVGWVTWHDGARGGKNE